MFEDSEEVPSERSLSPASRAKDKADEFRMHAELFAVFEAHRKFDAELISGFSADSARDLQRKIGKLEKSKTPDSPVLPDSSGADAVAVLDFAKSSGLSTNDYHIHRRPGEVMIVRWLEGDQVETFYERIQAHFDAAMGGYTDEERQQQEWKQNADTTAYLEALDALEIKMTERYLRDAIREHKIFVLSTQTADELNIAYLSDYVMGVAADEIVGATSAPPEEPTEQDLAWFYKLFSLRGMSGEGVEQMCFFTYLQKSDDMGFEE